jgi:hypothetical protein
MVQGVQLAWQLHKLLEHRPETLEVRVGRCHTPNARGGHLPHHSQGVD